MLDTLEEIVGGSLFFSLERRRPWLEGPGRQLQRRQEEELGNLLIHGGEGGLAHEESLEGRAG